VNNDDSSYLYHYTSIETAIKIIEGRSLRFGRLDRTDDPDEEQSSDMGNIGRFVYISCWTIEAEESIPMWYMYSKSMSGVRLGMKRFPFKKHHIPSGILSNSNPLESYCDLVSLNEQGFGSISPDSPTLIEVDYTNRDDLLYPKVKSERTSVEQFRYQEGDVRRKKSSEVSYAFDHIGAFKRKSWAFQKEWRYKVLCAPFTLNELRAATSHENQARLIARFENPSYMPLQDHLMLQLDDSAIANMEILVGPKADNDEIAKLATVAAEAGVKEPITMSRLRIR